MKISKRLRSPERGWSLPGRASRVASTVEPMAQNLPRMTIVRRASWGDRPLRIAIAAAVVAWIGMEFVFLALVHRDCEGESYRAFLPSQVCSVPAREAAAGMRPVGRGGYDGAFYYWQSNDLLGRYDAARHIDNVLYRYQRIGMPLLAGGLATLWGYELTPPLLYHTLQLAITAAGFGALVYWLLINHVNPVFSLGWLLGGGTFLSLWRGLLDAPGDAIFIFAFLSVMARRLWLYVPLTTLLLLTREGFAVYALAIFLVTIFSRLDWADVSDYWRRVTLVAVPGVVLLVWTCYLTIHFQMSPLVARANPDATSAPFEMMLHYVHAFFQVGDWFNLRLAVASGITLVVVSALMLRDVRRLPWALLCAIPFVLLTASLGKMVWEEHAGFLKANGTIVVLGLLMLPFDKSALLKLVLVLQAVVGVDFYASTNVMRPRFLCPQLAHEHGGYVPNPKDSPENPLLNDLRNSLEWVGHKPVYRRKYDGLWNLIHREVMPVTVAVTNRSDVAWQPGLGKHPIWLGYTLHGDHGKSLCKHSVILDQVLGPGETKEITTYVELRRPGHKFEVEFSLWQDGPGWFVKADPALGRRYEFVVE